MTTDPIQNAQKRAFQYWYVDGTFEFSFGGLCLVLAAYFYAVSSFGNSWVADLMSVLFALIVIGSGFIIKKMVMTMKERITFPRTGYVSFARKNDASRKKRILLALVSGAIASMMVVVLLQLPSGLDWAVALTGLIFGGVLAYLGFRIGIQRFFVSAFISLVIGSAFGFASLPENFGFVGYYGLMGLVLLTIGGFALWQYLRQNPERTEEEA